jgi:hypothetical protein
MNDTTPPNDHIVRRMSEEHKDLLGLSWREDAYMLVSPDADTTLDVKATVTARIAGEMRVQIREGKVVGLVLEAYEGYAGYFGPPSHVIESPERDGGSVPNAAYDLAVECLKEGMAFPNGWTFPDWCEWVC